MHIKFFRLIALMLLAIPLAVACNPVQREQVLNPHAYKAAINDESNEVVLDVRTPEEYSEGHLSGSVNADWNNSAAFAAATEKLDPDQPVFVYCKSGRRSNEAAAQLRKAGYTVYELQGGIEAWKKDGMKTTKEVENHYENMDLAAYHQLLEGDKLVLVDFYATWCGPCKQMSPFLREIAGEYADKVTILKIDVDKNEDVARNLQISSLPTILLYKNKKMVWSHIGYVGKQDLLEKISTFN